MRTFHDLLNDGSLALANAADDPILETWHFLEDAFSKPRPYFLSRLNEPVNDENGIEQFYLYLSRRKSGLPYAYCVGHAMFFDRRYRVNDSVLIPRPETELLVDTACDQLKIMIQRYEAPVVVLECGFGSGIISLECARRFPDQTIYAWDISQGAYDVAVKNALMHHISSVTWICDDFFSPDALWRSLSGTLKHMLVISNPPYIPSSDIQTLDPSVRNFEPHSALDGGEDGLRFYRMLFDEFSSFESAISIVCECGIGQSEILVSYANRTFSDNYISVLPDLAGIPRVLTIAPA